MSTSMCSLHRLSPGLLVAAALVLSPCIATAQQMDPNMKMPMSMPMPTTKPAPDRKPSAKPAVKKRKAPVVKSVHHSADHSTPTSDKTPESGGADHADMDMSMPMPNDTVPSNAPLDHAAMPGMAMPLAQPRTPIPTLTDADRVAAQPPAHDHPVHDNSIQNYTLIDRLETWHADNGGAFEWDAQSWVGTDLNRLRLRTEGARYNGRTEQADLEVLYSRSVATWWDVVGGIRHDFKPGASQEFAAIGVVGMAPYKFDVEATAYLGQAGQTAARVDLEYETLLTNRLILQPRVEVNLFGRDDARRGVGSGLSTAEVGLRLRYEITRRFAPYIGVTRERAFGDTATFRRDDGQATNDTRFVAGLRIWF